MTRKSADIYQNVFNAFLKTETPSDWLDMHKRYLTLLKNWKIYTGLDGFQARPRESRLIGSNDSGYVRAEAETTRIF